MAPNVEFSGVPAGQARHCAAQPAATVVERADSATGVVECGSLNVSDNAQPAASGEPVAWIEGPHGEIRRNLLWKLDPMPPQSVAWSIPLYTMSPKATSGTCTPQPAPARVPLTDAQAHAMWVNATIERTDMGSVYLRGLRDGEAAHGITAPPAT